MAKHASPSARLQVVESPRTVAIQLPLPVLGALSSARGALLDLFVGVGQQVLEALMEHDREVLCGPKGKHDPERRATRSGSTHSEVTLGGRRIAIRRLRARGAQGELGLPSFAFAADRDPLDEHTLEAIAAGVSTRTYARSLEPLSKVESRSTSKSAAGRVKLYSAPGIGPLRSEEDAQAILEHIRGEVFRGRPILEVLAVYLPRSAKPNLIERGMCPHRSESGTLRGNEARNGDGRATARRPRAEHSGVPGAHGRALDTSLCTTR